MDFLFSVGIYSLITIVLFALVFPVVFDKTEGETKRSCRIAAIFAISVTGSFVVLTLVGIEVGKALPYTKTTIDLILTYGYGGAMLTILANTFTSGVNLALKQLALYLPKEEKTFWGGFKYIPDKRNRKDKL